MKPFKKSKIFQDETGLGEGYEEVDLKGAEDYDPTSASKKERGRALDRLLASDQQAFVEERLSGSVTTGGQKPGNITQYGPPGDIDAVPFETEQSKALQSLEADLKTLRDSAKYMADRPELLNKPMTQKAAPKEIKTSGDPTVDAIRKESAQSTFDYEQKSSARKGTGAQKLIASEFINQETGQPHTYKSYYEGQITDKVIEIEMEKQRMGESYEKQTRVADVQSRYQSIGEQIDPIDTELNINDEGMKKKASKASKQNISNVGGADVSRQRTDSAAPLKQVPRGAKETGDIFKGMGTFGFFSEEVDQTRLKAVAKKNYANALAREKNKILDTGKIKNKAQLEQVAIQNLQKKDISEAKLVKKYMADYYKSPKGAAIMGTQPRDNVIAERFKASEGSPKAFNIAVESKSTGYTGLDDEAPRPGPGAGDRTRAKFKAKYGGGNVVAGSKNVKPTNLQDVSQTDPDLYNKSYKSAIAKGLDDVTAAAVAAKAVKIAKGALGKNPMLMPVTEFFSPIKKALDDVTKKKDYTR
tara:strand:+ start:249 stop:1835 length:1587 start_codon:yes stop_codon:yes gene_type:complete